MSSGPRLTHVDAAASGEAIRISQRDRLRAVSIDVQRPGFADRLASSRNTRDARSLFQGVANLPVAERAAVRLNAFSNSQDSFIFNRRDATYLGGFTNWGGRARFLWDPVARLRLNIHRLEAVERRREDAEAHQCRNAPARQHP